MISRRFLGLTAALLGIGCTDANAPHPVNARAPRSAANEVDPRVTFYGPERFFRERGGPQVIRRAISTIGYRAPFVLHVRNGDAGGSNRASSAVVRLRR